MPPSIKECYNLLEINPGATDEEITKAFRRLAVKYHPDKNRDKIEWANNVMARINQAYSIVLSARFEESSADQQRAEDEIRRQQQEAQSREIAQQKLKEMLREKYIADFVRVREDTKDYLYRYFQYNLDNFMRREEILNRGTFGEIVRKIRYCYHTLSVLSAKTDDDELLRHFKVFQAMIFSFYKASECLNVLDSYSNVIDVEAYRLYIEGDRYLHLSQKEIFYERHNRGSFRQQESVKNVIRSAYFFRTSLDSYPDSSWNIESKIKLDYAEALLNYINLFFNEDE